VEGVVGDEELLPPQPEKEARHMKTTRHAPTTDLEDFIEDLPIHP
jgi:hypothetical protein